eukprot:38771-Hanusia_phi.AAC.3
MGALIPCDMLMTSRGSSACKEACRADRSTRCPRSQSASTHACCNASHQRNKNSNDVEHDIGEPSSSSWQSSFIPRLCPPKCCQLEAGLCLPSPVNSSVLTQACYRVAKVIMSGGQAVFQPERSLEAAGSEEVEAPRLVGRKLEQCYSLVMPSFPPDKPRSTYERYLQRTLTSRSMWARRKPQREIRKGL